MRCEKCRGSMKKTDNYCTHCGRKQDLPFDEFVPAAQYKLPQKIVSLIKEGHMDYKQIAKELQKCKGFDNYKLYDLREMVYTESTYWNNEISISVFDKDTSIKEYIIMAHAKESCKICRCMDRKKFKIKNRKRGVNFPPFHSGCGCTYNIVTPDYKAVLKAGRKKNGHGK